MIFYITFGQAHVNVVNGKIFDRNCVAMLEAENEKLGRGRAFELFNDQWHRCKEYREGESDKEIVEYFPSGKIWVDR